ncbi:hypothetical protein NG799_04760 [Laspinema sp. D1]|uniref:Uncharacterized protein n=1 Tax=Laspinema palackyanum D2a TaxID=2953684 RepID=A0ABT2MLM2_9CYAN|nr:hypothetical protein [Laspinema sp. D2a]
MHPAGAQISNGQGFEVQGQGYSSVLGKERKPSYQKGDRYPIPEEKDTPHFGTKN